MRKTLIAAVLLALAALAPASAQIVVDHQPYPFGGPGSDTAFPSSQLPFRWQQSADDFTVLAPAHITRINWWGFHVENTAPFNETMRVRVYTAVPSDGLPGELLYERLFENPTRIDTGRTIAIGGRPIEYRYHVDLGTPLDLFPDVLYWLEVVQVGDNQSGFRFEFSFADVNGFAFRNNLASDWSGETPALDLAFQLIVPEPATAVLILFGALGLRRRVPP